MWIPKVTGGNHLSTQTVPTSMRNDNYNNGNNNGNAKVLLSLNRDCLNKYIYIYIYLKCYYDQEITSFFSLQSLKVCLLNT